MFRDRLDAAERLAVELEDVRLHDPLVLGIPRGGVALGALLARRLGAEIDVILARKLRAPGRPELAIGAVGEDGEMYLDRSTIAITHAGRAYVEQERALQLTEIRRRRVRFRSVRPEAPVADRSVILTDDGIATGSTMNAAMHVVRRRRPRELIVAVPVAPPGWSDRVRAEGPQVVCLLEPSRFRAVGQFYEDFDQLDDDEVERILREATGRSSGAAR